MLIPYLAALTLAILFALCLVRMARPKPALLPVAARCCECCQDQKLEVERPVI